MTADDTGAENTGPNLGVCARYIECARKATPQGVTAVISAYGEMGGCWELAGVREEDCWLECEAQMSLLNDAFPEVAECYPCQSNADCTSETHPVCVEFCDWERDGTELTCVRERRGCAPDTHMQCNTDRQSNSTCAHQPYPAGNLDCEARQAGRCASDHAVGSCALTRAIAPSPLVVVFYDDGDKPWTPLGAHAYCIDRSGEWTPAN